MYDLNRLLNTKTALKDQDFKQNCSLLDSSTHCETPLLNMDEKKSETSHVNISIRLMSVNKSTQTLLDDFIEKRKNFSESIGSNSSLNSNDTHYRKLIRAASWSRMMSRKRSKNSILKQGKKHIKPNTELDELLDLDNEDNSDASQDEEEVSEKKNEKPTFYLCKCGRNHRVKQNSLYDSDDEEEYFTMRNSTRRKKNIKFLNQLLQKLNCLHVAS